MHIMEKMVTRGIQHGGERIIEHESHRTARSDAVRRVFSSGGRIVGCRISQRCNNIINQTLEKKLKIN